MWKLAASGGGALLNAMCENEWKVQQKGKTCKAV